MDVKKEAGGAGFLDPEIKIEEENPVAAKEGAVEEGGPRAKMAGRSCADTGHRVAQELEENTSGNWDARLQAFVETLQAPPSVRATPQLLERKLCHELGRSPGGPQGTGEAGRSPQRLWGSPKQPRLTGDVGQQPSPPWDPQSVGKDQGGALAGKLGWAEQRRQRFRTVRYQDARRPRDVCRQLRERCREWLEPERRTKEQMVELVALEQFVAVLPPEMQSWVQEGGPVTCAQAVALAEAFLLRQAEAENRELQVTGLSEEYFANAPIPRAALPGPEKLQLPAENEHSCKGTRSLLGSEGRLRENKERKPPVGSHAQRGRPTTYKKTGQESDDQCYREAEGNPQKAEGPNGDVAATGADRPVLVQGVCEGISRPAAQEAEKEEKEEEEESGLKDEAGREEPRFTVSEDPETEPRPFRCWHCGQRFGSSVRLVTHERTHVGEKFYTCLYCGRSERTHTGQKPHKCSRCGKTLDWNPQERLYEGETPSSCSDYGNSCSQRSDLVNHQRMHTGEDKRDEPDHEESAEGPREIKRELEEGAPQAEEPKKKQRLMVETRKMDPNTSNPGPKQKRRSYAAGFKLQVVSRAEETNNSIASREFCVDEKQVREWRKMKAELERIPAAKKARRGLTTSYGALETELCKWVMECRQNGYRVTRMGIRLRALQMAQDGQLKAPGIESFVASAGWCSRFMNRFALCWRQRTDISQKLPQGLDEKAMSFHSFIIKQRKLHNYDLGDIGNMDETPVAFDLPSDGTVASSGDKTTSLTTAGNKTNCFTVVLSCLANGTKLRPVVIFKRKSLPQAVQFPPRITVRAHDKGWLDEDGAKKWLEEIWNGRPGAGLRKKPSLLVWDEFGAHTSEDVTKLAKSSQVTLAVVPGGLVSVLQPLGAYLHKPFKDHVQKMWHEWMSSGQAPLTQVGNLMSPSVELIARWVQDAWEEIPEDMVQCAFKKCGISSATDGTEDSALCENDSSDGYDCELSGDDNIYADNLTSANAGALLGHTEEESSFEGV